MARLEDCVCTPVLIQQEVTAAPVLLDTTRLVMDAAAKILMNVPPDRTTAQRTRCALIHTEVSSVSVWIAQKSLMLLMSKRLPCAVSVTPVLWTTRHVPRPQTPSLIITWQWSPTCQLLASCSEFQLCDRWVTRYVSPCWVESYPGATSQFNARTARRVS